MTRHTPDAGIVKGGNGAGKHFQASRVRGWAVSAAGKDGVLCSQQFGVLPYVARPCRAWQGRVTQRALDDAMKELGFERDGDRFVHPDTEFFIEFPPGPLSIGDDLSIEPEPVSLGGPSALALSPTDSCRNRLAAFYHWDDRQALQLAVGIARRQKVDIGKIREWSASEGMTVKCEEFLAELAHGRRRGGRRRS